jgi:Arginine methyltransferase oligomerization subdomain/Ribosomal protein L11 methyltransferase (PrmA)
MPTTSTESQTQPIEPTQVFNRPADLYMQFGGAGEITLRGSSRSGQMKVNQPMLQVLGLIDGQRTIEQVSVEASKQWKDAKDPLTALAQVTRWAKVLEDQGLIERTSPEQVVDQSWGYHRPEVHRTMLQDEPRTYAFRDALREVVKEGDVVLDMGTGTGILALFAAQAGAKEVHAIEQTTIVDMARSLAATNGIENVTFHQIEAENLELPVKADVLVSEWLGYFVYSDAMYTAVASLRDRCVKKDTGIMIPATVDLLLAPLAEDPARANVPAYWTIKPYGFDYTPMLEDELRNPLAENRVVGADTILAEPQVLHHIDCKHDQMEDLYFSKTGAFVCQRDALLTTFCGWFTTELSPSVILDTGPAAPETHWQQRLFPVPPIEVKEGDRIDYTFVVRAHSAEPWRTEHLLEATVHHADGPTSFSYVYEDY